LHFLVEHFSFFGFDGQNWMIIVAAIIAGFVLVLGTRRRN
jgi:LPXTG-motif cell wall-anchored protein